MPDTVNPQITDAAVTAFPTPVNSQITDAVTQANVKSVAQAPAIAMGSVYQALAHSTGILFENAVSQQQQQNLLAQASASMGITQIYTVDKAAAAVAAEPLSRTSIDAQAVQAPLEAARKATAAINSQIVDAVNFSLDTTLLHSGDVAYGVRAACDALVASIERVNRANQENLLRIVQLAARTACLAAMVREPDKAAAYNDVLAAIDRLA